MVWTRAMRLTAGGGKTKRNVISGPKGVSGRWWTPQRAALISVWVFANHWMRQRAKQNKGASGIKSATSTRAVAYRTKRQKEQQLSKHGRVVLLWTKKLFTTRHPTRIFSSVYPIWDSKDFKDMKISIFKMKTATMRTTWRTAWSSTLSIALMVSMLSLWTCRSSQYQNLVLKPFRESSCADVMKPRLMGWPSQRNAWIKKQFHKVRLWSCGIHFGIIVTLD